MVSDRKIHVAQGPGSCMVMAMVGWRQRRGGGVEAEMWQRPVVVLEVLGTSRLSRSRGDKEDCARRRTTKFVRWLVVVPLVLGTGSGRGRGSGRCVRG